MSLALITHPVFASHEVPGGHPEAGSRITATTEALSNLRAPDLTEIQAPRATREQLDRVHAPAYVDAVFDSAPADGLIALDPETTMGPHSLGAAVRAAGAVCHGVDLVLSGDARHVFCLVRPPGHHAASAHASGFCIFNNVAVGAAHALAQDGIARVAILDFDVHHGDGTEAIVRDDPRVLMCSTYQHPFYPGTNLPSVPGRQVNVPLPAGTGGQGFQTAITERWLPELDAFAPQLVFISAGFDAHVDDPLGQLALKESDFAWATERAVEVAERHAQGRVVSVLEGGYNLEALSASVVAHVRALEGLSA
ncbi:MAG: histone deacetylase family protein [Pseudomonadota bacterium]